MAFRYVDTCPTGHNANRSVWYAVLSGGNVQNPEYVGEVRYKHTHIHVLQLQL